MAPLRRAFRSRWIVIGPFLAVICLLVAVGFFSADTLSAVRAFVGGESLWSKGQKDAFYYLGRYAESHAEGDYRQFRQALAYPLGDQLARLELDKPNPDLERVRIGFLAGGNHPDDIDGMVRLYLRFHRLSFMARAVAFWVEGDRGIAELSELGERVHALIARGDGDSPALRDTLSQLPPLNERLTVLSQHFSSTLGEASRAAQQIVMAATLLLSLALALVGVWLTARILREQARIEQALRQSNERWDLAAAASQIGVFEWDLARQRIALDSRAAALCGLPPEMRGVMTHDFSRDAIHPDDRDRVREAMQRSLEAQVPAELRFRVRRPDGVARHLELSANRSIERDGRRRVVGILWDVTDDVQAEQLRLDKEAAERANRAKTEFLSRVSHELRTPLNAILGFAQLLQVDRADPLSEGQAARVGHVLAGGQHLLGLINDVLDLTSIDQGAFALSERDIDLAELLRGSAHRVEPLARSQAISLTVEVPERAPLRADPLRLQQVFANLLSNAIKYNRAGGAIGVRLRSSETHYSVEFSDTGRGMSKIQVAQLFQPFNRLGAEHTKVEGSGLGLVITRQLIERMGGTLAIASEAGAGSTFTVEMPRVAASARS